MKRRNFIFGTGCGFLSGSLVSSANASGVEPISSGSLNSKVDLKAGDFNVADISEKIDRFISRETNGLFFSRRMNFVYDKDLRTKITTSSMTRQENESFEVLNVPNLKAGHRFTPEQLPSTLSGSSFYLDLSIEDVAKALACRIERMVVDRIVGRTSGDWRVFDGPEANVSESSAKDFLNFLDCDGTISQFNYCLVNRRCDVFDFVDRDYFNSRLQSKGIEVVYIDNSWREKGPDGFIVSVPFLRKTDIIFCTLAPLDTKNSGVLDFRYTDPLEKHLLSLRDGVNLPNGLMAVGYTELSLNPAQFTLWGIVSGLPAIDFSKFLTVKLIES